MARQGAEAFRGRGSGRPSNKSATLSTHVRVMALIPRRFRSHRVLKELSHCAGSRAVSFYVER